MTCTLGSTFVSERLLTSHVSPLQAALLMIRSSLHLSKEGFNDWGGRGYDDFVPGEVTKTAPSGMRLHDPLHGRQACPDFVAFDQGVDQICPR